MRQIARYRWRLESPKGKVMVDDLNFSNAYNAEQWVISYISSYSSWSFRLITLEEK